jgi:hypothetical protein
MGLQPLHTPEDLAVMLGRSRWWVCEQCRRGRFPSIKPGGSYRFTDQHVNEILAILEQAPVTTIGKGKGRTAKSKRASPARSSGAAPGVQLKARPPRRRKAAAQASSPTDSEPRK